MTPQLVINAGYPGVVIPVERVAVQGSEVILNIHEQAVSGYRYEDEEIVFKTRFSGRSYDVAIPFDAAIAIFTRETHEGLYLVPITQAESTAADEAIIAERAEQTGAPKASKPHLKLVK